MNPNDVRCEGCEKIQHIGLQVGHWKQCKLLSPNQIFRDKIKLLDLGDVEIARSLASMFMVQNEFNSNNDWNREIKTNNIIQFELYNNLLFWFRVLGFPTIAFDD